MIRKIIQYFCKHNFVETEYYPYPPDMYQEKTCTKCGKKIYFDL